MVHFDPFSRQHADDPYPTYKLLRDEAPVYHNADLKFWALTRHADVVAALRDAKRFISSEGITIDRFGAGLPMLLTRDAPDHNWHKALATRVFSNAKMAALEPFIRDRAVSLIESLDGRDEVDIFNDFTLRLPLDVISELIGIPVEFRDEVHHLSSVALLRGEAADPVKTRESIKRRHEIYHGLVEERRSNPREDTITALIEQEVLDDDGKPRRFTTQEIVYHFSELASAGHETVAKAICNAFIALDRFPAERAKIEADRARIPMAVEEMLRWESPSQYQGRCAAVDIEMHGVTIPAGDMVMLVNASAARDEREFDRPDELDFDRDLDQRTIHFGFGVHKCLGIHLARIELRVALEEMFDRYPDFRVFPDRATRDIVTSVRGVSSLPASLGAHA